VGNMAVARSRFSATVLLNGDVLVAGGDNFDKRAELYHAASRTFSVTGSMTTPQVGGSPSNLRYLVEAVGHRFGKASGDTTGFC